MKRSFNIPPAKSFCIAGPIVPSIHYFLPERLNQDQLIGLIQGMNYFGLHAPRQSGKTTAINEFVKFLQGTAGIKALYINIEDAQAARENVEKALIAIVSILRDAIEEDFPEDQAVVLALDKLIDRKRVSITLFRQALTMWAKLSDKPIALFIDEIDSLIGDSLLSVLRQIRAGFIKRPKRFLQSICLIGLRDVRDYRIWSKEEGAYVSTASLFNIKAVSLLLSNFSEDEVRLLYQQHTAATGQLFTDAAIEHAYYLTQGQPWLVNALAQEACFALVLDRTQPITEEIINQAKDVLILRRDTHIDSLMDKLNEPRISNIIDAVISGGTVQEFRDDDVQYCKDLGLLSTTDQTLEIANPIYKQIIPAALCTKFQRAIVLN